MAEKIKDLDIDLVVGPAMGGVVVSYELGRQLKKEAIFTERKDIVALQNLFYALFTPIILEKVLLPLVISILI